MYLVDGVFFFLLRRYHFRLRLVAFSKTEPCPKKASSSFRPTRRLRHTAGSTARPLARIYPTLCLHSCGCRVFPQPTPAKLWPHISFSASNFRHALTPCSELPAL